jgi:hypothetical protein
MKIAFKLRFIISFILLLQIIPYSAIAQSKKEQISILNYQLDSLKKNVQIEQIKTREFEAQLISVNKNLNELLRELMITKKSLAKEDSLKTVFENELKSAIKKLLLSEEKSLQMNNALSSYKVEIDDLKNELTKRDSLISIYEKQSLLDKDSILLLNPAKPKHELQIMDKPPIWGEQLRTINLGTYSDALRKDNPEYEILALHSWGDRTIGITPPFQEYLYLVIDNQSLFLKFINYKNKGEHSIQTYEYGVYKVVLDYAVKAYTRSGIGSGGIFYLYYNNKLIRKYTFWASI